MDMGYLYLLLACLFGLLMTWGVGANDLANILSTTIGSKAVTVRQAIIIAIIFEFAGAFLGGANVTHTIRNGIIDTSSLLHHSQLLIYGMLAILLAGTTWMWLATFVGMPVSITNAIVGALVGFGMVIFGPDAIMWTKVKYIAISWISSPISAGVIAYLLFNTIKRSILGSVHPAQAMLRYAPIYLLLVGFVLGLMIVVKGLIHMGIHLSHLENFAVDSGTSLLIMLLGMFAIRRIPYTPEAKLHEQFTYVEKVFSLLMALTACSMVFAHGSNDVAISIGPIAAIDGILQHGTLSGDVPIPAWIFFLGCAGVILGLVMYGRKVIETVGSGITKLTPSRAFSATLAAAGTVIVSTSTGIPVSATQTLVGAVLGVGLARGIGALNIDVIRNIFLSWIITLPAAASLAIAYFYVLKYLFH
jgi:PiT family inorganic phosphate transporter